MKREVVDEFGGMHEVEEMEEDIIRILRVIEYVGPRSAVELQVEHSIHGQRIINQPSGVPLVIRAATIGLYPEILEAACVVQQLTQSSGSFGTIGTTCGHPRREGGSSVRTYCTEPGCQNYVPF